MDSTLLAVPGSRGTTMTPSASAAPSKPSQTMLIGLSFSFPGFVIASPAKPHLLKSFVRSGPLHIEIRDLCAEDTRGCRLLLIGTSTVALLLP